MVALFYSETHESEHTNGLFNAEQLWQLRLITNVMEEWNGVSFAPIKYVHFSALFFEREATKLHQQNLRARVFSSRLTPRPTRAN